MQQHGDRLIVSPTDLVGYLYCPHLTNLSTSAALGQVAVPQRDDPELDVLTRRGDEHERAWRRRLEGEGLRVVDIEVGDGRAPTLEQLREAERQTREAMAAGVDVVFQATFLDETGSGPAWRGHADFLRRVGEDEPPRYEPEDTKLARRVRVGALLQLAQYAEQVERLQGAPVEHVSIVLGDSRIERFRPADYAAVYRRVKQRFEDALGAGTPATYPEPVEHCAVCRWQEVCQDQRITDDHLSLVPFLTREQTRKLRAAGIDTVAGLAAAEDVEVRGIAGPTLERLRHQARLEVQAREAPHRPPPFTLLSPEAGLGLGALPTPDAADLYFDIEGDPFAFDGGLEYLFGVGRREDGAFRFRTWWAHDRAEERAAVRDLVGFFTDWLAANPGAHIYHYAPYETAALGRLVARHGVCEDDFDELLRRRAFVDLYRVLRQGVLVGAGSYSLKALEPLYRDVRAEAITSAAGSIVEYERWLETREQRILDEIEAYNRADVDSLTGLHDWLEARRADLEVQHGTQPRPPALPAAVDDTREELPAEIAALVVDLRGGAETAPADVADPTARARVLLAALLDWHRREARPEWWRYFDRLEADEQGLFDDTEAVAGLEYDGEVGREKRSILHAYRFDPAQENKLRISDRVVDPDVARRKLLTGDGPPGPGELVEIDGIRGRLVLKRGATSAAPHPRCVIPSGPITDREQRQALRRLAASVSSHGIDAPGRFQAIRDLLRRRPPRIIGLDEGGPLVGAGESPQEAVTRLAFALDRSYLPVQGPPGSGKTHTGAQLIVALLAAGKRVGISAFTHAAINELLVKTLDAGADAGVAIRAMQRAEGDKGCGRDDVALADNADEVAAALGGQEANLVTGTAWLFACEAMEEQLDYLVVDEAGQMSLANVAAIAGAAHNLVLVGDPQQLAQPSKGTHPPGAEVSALDHLLDGQDTMPPERGVFLDRSRRMHPEICAFVSERSYDGRLEPEPRLGLERQRVDEGPVLSGSGLRWSPVDHHGNRTSSEEEVDEVARIHTELLGRQWTDRDGASRPLGVEDILVVAPYNAQVALLTQALPAGARVGTVDRFQGQEAPVVLVSLAASSQEDIPRGMEFLFSRNRLNVALSRAQALAVCVFSPRLLDVRCRTVEQLYLANGMCRLAEYAQPLT